ncbi:folate-binding protein YgfZ [Sphaerospermopsis sp. LEGE 08334]|uniref:CAF17-like 4Fe-4S cluster assembly/insertion protein YgfZ n=1 Tax=Sphaerospermopsis sp. LEGE 08334 TaxID=1828651 RepID=UPI00187EDDE3|nr:folate-binding protein YgfZ [Sphaerospermopsis sp. LEGE 08334]MBE9059190.1 folate-binding protein YgfZ [Sphaerospermopsis sp. LEGE 08334]
MPKSVVDSKDATVIRAAQEGVAVCDRSHWGRIRVSDDDRLRFLHNQSTNDFQRLRPGEGCDTVMVTSTARTIDLVTGYLLDDAVLLLVSPHRRTFLMEWLDRYIFFADKVTLTDITDETATFSLIGPQSDAIVEKLGAGSLIGKPNNSHIVVDNIIFAVGSGLAIPGYTLIFPVAEKQKIWQQILDSGAIELSDRHWETLRILQGRPVPDAELTDDYNPLEVGLWQTVSFNKGCYIGQETIARLNTYKGVKQYLWGISLNAPAAPGSVITIGDEKVGKLTSYTETPEGHFGLGYIRSKAGGVGLKVQVGNSEGEVVSVPFISHEYP